ncbi:hypothetical protein R75461_08300 [Paraburkholderia nemoris]|nr:hypothetical protein R75461_08300 [Paraburkholderia nemoris]
MPHRQLAQKDLFEKNNAVPPPQLTPQVRTQLQQQMVQWMQAVAVMLTREVRDEQDH